MSLSAEKFAELLILGKSIPREGFPSHKEVSALIKIRDEARDKELSDAVAALPRHVGDTLVKLDDVIRVLTMANKNQPDVIVG